MAKIIGTASVKVTSDTTGFSTTAGRGIKKDLEDSIKGNELDPGLNKVKKDLDKFGKDASSLFTGIWKGIKAGAIAGLASIAPQAANALIPLLGTLGLIPGAVGIAGAAIGTLALGLHGFGTALADAGNPAKVKQFNTALAGMAPSAREAVTVLAGLKTQFKGLQLDVQQKLFAGLASQIKSVATADLPVLRTGLGSVATALGGAGKQLLSFLGSASARNSLGTLFGSAATSVHNFADAIRPLGTAILTIMAVSSQAVARLTSNFGGVATAFNNFVQKVAGNGQLFSWIEQGVSQLFVLGDIARNVGSIVLTVLKGLDSTGGTFLDTLSKLTFQLSQFLKSAQGQAALKAIGDAMAAIGNAAGPVFLALLQGVAQILVQISPFVQELAKQLGTALVGVIHTLTPLLVGFATWLGNNANVAAHLAIVLGGLFGALKVLSLVATLVTTFKDLREALLLMAGAETIAEAVTIGLDAALSPIIALGALIASPVVIITAAIVAVGVAAFLLIKNWSTVVSFLGSTWRGIESLAKTVWNAIASFFATVWDGITSVTTKVWSAIVTFLSGVWNSVIGKARSIWGAVTSFFSGIWDSVSGAFKSAWDTITKVLVTAWTTVVNATRPIWEPIVGIIEDIFSILRSIIIIIVDGIAILLIAAWNGISSAAVTAWNAIAAFFTFIWNGIVTVFHAVFDPIAAFLTTVWNAIVSATTFVWNSVVIFLTNVWNAIVNAFHTVFDPVASFLAAVWNSVSSFARSVWNSVSSFLRSVWNGIVSFLRAVFGPVASFFAGVWNSVSSFARSVWNSVSGFLRGVWNGIVSVARSIFNPIASFFRSAWNAASTAVRTVVGGIVSFVRGIPGTIVRVLGNLGSLLFNAGKQIIEGLLNGLKSAFDAVKNFVGGIAGYIQAHKGPEPVDRGLLVGAGQLIMQGLINGMASQLDPLSRFLGGVTDTIAGSFSGASAGVDIGLSASALAANGGGASGTAVLLQQTNNMLPGTNPQVFAQQAAQAMGRQLASGASVIATAPISPQSGMTNNLLSTGSLS